MRNFFNGNWRKYIYEFLTIFIGVFAAFALDSWNDDRKDSLVQNKILTEISSGLEKDILDMQENESGHLKGIEAVRYFNKILNNQPINKDSLVINYITLLRDFVSIQNISGYETLKSKGLEIIKNDSLRSAIISLYEYDYKTLKKLEEDYGELQFHESYFKDFNASLAPHFIFDKKGNIIDISRPLQISEKDKKILQTQLLKIYFNRNFILQYYKETKTKVLQLQKHIQVALKN